MDSKTKILIGALVALIIILVGGWWIWNFYYKCSIEKPWLCKRDCRTDEDCYPACGCGCINSVERCSDQCLWDHVPYSCKCINGTCTITKLEIDFLIDSEEEAITYAKIDPDVKEFIEKYSAEGFDASAEYKSTKGIWVVWFYGHKTEISYGIAFDQYGVISSKGWGV